MMHSRYNETCVKYYGLLGSLHSGIGDYESEELESIQEEMVELWYELTEAQRDEFNGIGSDLNWAYGNGLPAPMLRSKEEVSQEELDEFRLLNTKDNLEAEEAVRFLHVIRLCAPLLTVKEMIPCRIKCYRTLGMDQVADTIQNMQRK